MSDLERAGPQVICDETRLRAHGYQLRCHELVGHDGEHRWTPELLRGLREQRDCGGAR